MTGSNSTPNAVGFSQSRGDLSSGSIVIVGAGLAGLFTALKLAPTPVTVISAAHLGTGAASAWAQGGIAAAVGQGDTTRAHAQDTVIAGAGLVDAQIAKMVADEAPDRIYDLLDYGVPFDQNDSGDFILSREAAHSAKRIVRVSGDKAGAAIMQTLVERVHNTPSIQVLEGYELEDVILTNGSVSGVKVSQITDAGLSHHEISDVAALVLATGGLGALYSITTNPSYSRGTALSIAARAGALISDAEFVQFHPTALDFGIDPAPLATESLRGEGALLINASGEQFMAARHPDGDLAPRDVVTRGVFAQTQNGQGAYLDCTRAIGKHFEKDFPTVFKSCQRAGFDPAIQPLPIVTAAHYHMGGIATDIRARTTVPGLWAVGEVAATGLHGANRLASNSLLETLVFGARAADDIASTVSLKRPQTLDHPDFDLKITLKKHTLETPADQLARNNAIQRLRKVMSRYVGVIRTKAGLLTAQQEIENLQKSFKNDPLIANMSLAARFVVVASLLREESRGAHYRSDCPDAISKTGTRSFLTLNDINAPNTAHKKIQAALQPTQPVGRKDKCLAESAA